LGNPNWVGNLAEPGRNKVGQGSKLQLLLFPHISRKVGRKKALNFGALGLEKKRTRIFPKVGTPG